jgi:hypothetical protein
MKMATFDKAKNNNKKSNGKKWYIVYTKNHSIYLWALPIAPFVIGWMKFDDWRYKRLQWTEERATKVLNKVLPKVLEYTDNAYWYSPDWGSSHMHKYCSLVDKKWARKFAYKLQQFVEKGYENPEYTKTVEREPYCTTWVKFVEK